MNVADQRGDVIDVDTKPQHHTQLRAALAEDGKQLSTTDAAEAVSTGAHRASIAMHFDVIPMVERPRQVFGRGGVCCIQALDRLVTQHNAPAERIVRLVSFNDDDFCFGIAPACQQCRVQPAGASTDDQQSHAGVRQLAICGA